MNNEKIICADGFEMSVQASETHYCTPRKTHAERYEAVEVGYPTPVEGLLMPYCEDPDKPCETVYGYVPVSVVNLVIAKHGGIVRGQAPPGVAYMPAQKFA